MTTIEEIKEKVATDSRWTERAILALYQRQTLDEQSTKETESHNGVGFNSIDAFILTDFAKWLIAGRHLTVKQLAVAQKKLPKYSKQLLDISKEK